MKNNRSRFKKFLAISTAIAVATILFGSSLSTAEEDFDWGYGGANNSTQWSDISPEFESCQLGRDQSPINIEDIDESIESADYIEAGIKFDYQPSEVAVVDNGHTIEVDFQPGNTITIDGKTYELLQFHFHTPSEHTIEGKSAPMELHLVHQSDDKELAVIGVMMNVGKENSTIARIWDAIPSGDKADSKSTINLAPSELLPESKSFVAYPGSLTTPPCSEEVSWNLLLEPIEVSAEQVETFESIYPYNARPVQPLNGRSVEVYSDE